MFFNLTENTYIHSILLNFDLILLGLMATQICGAFLSSDWAQKNFDEKGFKFFGTGECFVFTVSLQLPSDSIDVLCCKLHVALYTQEYDFNKLIKSTFQLRPGMEQYQRTVLQISGMSDKCDSSHQKQTLSTSSLLSTHVDRPTGASQNQRYESATLSTFKFMAGNDETLFIGELFFLSLMTWKVSACNSGSVIPYMLL